MKAGFFQDDKGNNSLSRLVLFMSFFPSTLVLLKTQDSTIFGWYVSSYAAAYGGGKIADMMGEKRNAVADKEL